MIESVLCMRGRHVWHETFVAPAMDKLTNPKRWPHRACMMAKRRRASGDRPCPRASCGSSILIFDTSYAQAIEYVAWISQDIAGMHTHNWIPCRWAKESSLHLMLHGILYVYYIYIYIYLINTRRSYQIEFRWKDARYKKRATATKNQTNTRCCDGLANWGGPEGCADTRQAYDM